MSNEKVTIKTGRIGFLTHEKRKYPFYIRYCGFLKGSTFAKFTIALCITDNDDHIIGESAPVSYSPSIGNGLTSNKSGTKISIDNYDDETFVLKVWNANPDGIILEALDVIHADGKQG
jgi:hypothetical protein